MIGRVREKLIMFVRVRIRVGAQMPLARGLEGSYLSLSSLRVVSVRQLAILSANAITQRADVCHPSIPLRRIDGIRGPVGYRDQVSGHGAIPFSGLLSVEWTEDNSYMCTSPTTQL
jgi:hypothetical protein